MREGSDGFFVAISAKHDDKPRFDQSTIGAIGIPEKVRQFKGILYMGPVFDQVFSYTYEPDLNLLEDNSHCSLDIPELGFQQTLKLKRMVFLTSESDKLGKTETNDHFLILEFYPPDNGKRPKLRGRGQPDKLIVNAYLDAILTLPSAQPFSELLNTFRVEYPGILGDKNEPCSEAEAEHVKPYLFCYYYYAHLICWRLEREQIALKLNVMEEPEEQLLKTISVHRLRVINLYRYFLTNNRSNNTAVKAFCAQRVEAHKIVPKYERYQKILTEFETYIDNMSTIAQTRGNKAVKKTLNLLAFFAIPLGIFGAIMQLSPHNDIIESPQDVLTNSDIWFWVGFSFIAPLSLLTIGYLYDRFVHHKTK